MTTTQLTPSAGTPAGDSETNTTKRNGMTRHLPTVARILMGLLFFVSGVVGLLHLTPPPPANLPPAAVAFDAGMMQVGYMMPLIFGTQAIVGALLLLNRFVPLALALFAPFLVNCLAFHAFVVPSGLGIAVFALMLELYLAWSYRNAFRPMLRMRVAPGD